MRSLLPALLVLVLVLVAVGCATTPAAEPVPEPAPKPAAAPGKTGGATDAEPVGPEDTCAAFNEQQKAVDAARHMETFGCPPCPCACVNGEITCAPCALCEPSDVPLDLPRDSAPTPTPAAPPPPPPPLKITFVDVGEGDAILIQSGEFDALVDTGPEGAWDGQLEVALATVKGPLELLFVTHPHEDRLGQADEVLDKVRVLRVITTGETRGPPRDRKTPAFYETFTTALAGKGLAAEPATLGESFFPAPGVRLEVLATGGRAKDTDQGSDINNDSLVLRLTYAGRVVLFTGDIEKEAGDWLVATHCPAGGEECPRLRADILAVAHHGSANFSERFLEKTRPSYAVVSAGFHVTTHCLPRVEQYQALKSAGARIFSTSAEGIGNVSVTITADGNMTWSTPNEPVFVWEGMKGKTCVGPTVFEQG